MRSSKWLLYPGRINKGSTKSSNAAMRWRIFGPKFTIRHPIWWDNI